MRAVWRWGLWAWCCCRRPSDWSAFCARRPKKALPTSCPIRGLILRLPRVQVPRGRAETPRMLYALVHLGLGESVVGYLARWAVNARVAHIEWARGGTSEVIDKSYLLQLTSPAPRFIGLL